MDITSQHIIRWIIYDFDQMISLGRQLLSFILKKVQVTIVGVLVTYKGGMCCRLCTHPFERLGLYHLQLWLPFAEVHEVIIIIFKPALPNTNALMELTNFWILFWHLNQRKINFYN